MAALNTTLLALLAGIASDDPEYPLGRLRAPPIAEAASPFRLVDLRYSLADDGGTFSSFETRVRVGGSMFLGGEVRGDRRGLFLDTQRVELGLSEENGSYEIEGVLRAPRLLLLAGASRENEDWSLATDGSIRASSDLELLFSFEGELGDSRFAPVTLEEFIDTGVVPEPGPATRLLRSGSAGVFYQRGSHLEVLGDLRFSRLRTEAGFDLDVERYRLATLWNGAGVELDAELAYGWTSGRLPRDELSARVGAEVEVGSHVLAHASTRQRGEPGILRFEESYRAGLTFFGRRHRFARRSEAAARLLELQREAVALGYNERRVWDVEGLRRFRERLGISAARQGLAEALEALYRAQVRERNVPQLGFAVEIGDDSLLGVESRSLHAFIGVPWRIRPPFARAEEAVEFLRGELVLRQDDFPGGIRALSRELRLAVFLNREMSLELRWERPGITPEEIVLERSRPSRITLSYEYALGR